MECAIRSVLQCACNFARQRIGLPSRNIHEFDAGNSEPRRVGDPAGIGNIVDVILPDHHRGALANRLGADELRERRHFVQAVSHRRVGERGHAMGGEFAAEETGTRL